MQSSKVVAGGSPRIAVPSAPAEGGSPRVLVRFAPRSHTIGFRVQPRAAVGKNEALFREVNERIREIAVYLDPRS
jgi:hypothetical protein